MITFQCVNLGFGMRWIYYEGLDSCLVEFI